MDPVSKLILTIDVGDRTLTLAQRLVHQGAQVGCLGATEHKTALRKALDPKVPNHIPF